MDPFAQVGFNARFEWGEAGIRTLSPDVGVLVIVDVLSFTTAVEAATTRGAIVFPYPFRDSTAQAFADEKGAVLAVGRHAVSAERPYSLSPGTFAGLAAGTRVVLPSPNGSHLSTAAGRTHVTVAGCLRNARGVAEWAQSFDQVVGVIAAGELRRDGSLRFAIEDLVGAGAILSHFPEDQRSPEGSIAVAAFESMRGDLAGVLAQCASGRELVQIGFADDVRLAAELDASTTVPVLRPGGWYGALSR